MFVDTRADVLQVLQTQGTSASVIVPLLGLLEQEASIVDPRAGFTQQKQRELLESARLECARLLAATVPQLEAEIDREARADLQALEEQRLARRISPSRAAAEAINVGRLSTTDDPTEIARALDDLRESGDVAALRQAWLIAEKRLRQLAAIDARQNRLTSPAFQTLCRLQMTIGKTSEGAPDVRRQEIGELSRRRKAESGQRLLQAARVLSLDHLVQRELLLAARQEGNIKVGPAFDKR